MNKYFLLLVMLSLLSSCNKIAKDVKLTPGIYRATLEVQDQEQLPFIFKVKDEYDIEIYNAQEIIEVSDVSYKNDSVFFRAPVFEGLIAAKIGDNGNLKGNFIKESLDRVLPFEAKYGEDERFAAKKAQVDVTGVWEVVFSEDLEGEYMAKGMFAQRGNLVNGTFRTPTGDYRFLEGVVDGKTLKLSAFDGAHAFLFQAEVSDSTMAGRFYSDNHWKEPFVGKPNANFELPNADTLTYLKEGYDSLEFSFPNADGDIVSLSDSRFKDKVVVVQIMGTWCPNCLDESKYFTEFYNDYKEEDFEMVALAFEYAKTQEKAFQGIQRLQERLAINYPILLAQWGTKDKVEAQKKLPMLNHVLSYPTSIFIDKNGKVRKIHTGFNGPATGEKYISFKKDFKSFIDELLVE